MSRISHIIARTYAICLVVTTVTHCSATNPVCSAPECKALGDSFLKHMDQNISPCTDFYGYVCNKWAAQNPRPKAEIVWNTERAMSAKILVSIRNLLQNRSPTNVPEIQTAKAVYQACTNLPFLARSEPSYIANLMKNVAYWPMFFPKNKEIPSDIPWWIIDNNYAKIGGESALFDVTVAADSENSNKIVTQFRPLFSPYGTIKRSDTWPLLSKQKGNYKTFLYMVIEKVAPSDPTRVKGVIEKDLDDVIRFRESLREISKSGPRNEFHVNAIRELQKWYDKQTQSKDTIKINWLRMVSSLYPNDRDANGVPITSNTRISVNVNYAEKLVKLLGATPKRVIVNHIHLYFAERHVKMTSVMADRLKQSINVADFPKSAVIDLLPRWEWCIYIHSMKRTLGMMYVATQFPPKIKAEVESLFERAKMILKKQIAQSTWLSSEMKSESINKVHHVRSSIGYPDDYVKYPTDNPSALFQFNPTDILMCYLPGPSIVYASAANLQPPIYNRNAPYVVNHGTLLTLLGHELYHVFGKNGLRHANGTNQPLWPEETYNRYKKQTMCFQEQYKKYTLEELDKYKLRSLFQRKIKSTVNEDLADVMGLKLGYYGYRVALEYEKGVCPVLPGFENIGCEKLFFISFANTFCADASPGMIERLYMNDEHSSPRIRVNGAVANMKEFSEAFGCKANDPLNIENRCDLWE